MGTQQRDSISGRLINWTFDDGVMAGKTFEHHFQDDGTVTFQCSDGSHKGSAHYDVVQLNDDVAAVTYTVDGGYTLTTVLDLRKHRLVAFSSNGKETQTQHGHFEPA